MDFLIADSFIDSLARLTNEEQRAVKTTVFDLQVNPANPGMNLHSLDRVQDANFHSIRVNRDVRIIVHRAFGNMLVCYVDHHDNAYDWARRRKLEQHPSTGAAQMVEIRERVEEIVIPNYVVEERPKPKLFAAFSDETLLGYGVPPEWLADVRDANEDSILAVAEHLPAEAAEALLELATGGTPTTPAEPVVDGDPFSHPDAQRRFRVMTNSEELAMAMDSGWDKWTVFLHPEQRKFSEGNFNGPARVGGSAGTGKTVVALHRAVFLARSNPNSRVLLSTFSDTLANALRGKLRRLIHNQPSLADQIEVLSMTSLAERLYRSTTSKKQLIEPQEVQNMVIQSAASSSHTFSRAFLLSEWEQIVDAWQLKDWEAYRDVQRLGRKIRLTETNRKVMWAIYQQVLKLMEEREAITYAGIFTELASLFSSGQRSPYDFVVVDEAQDINIPQLRLLAALCDNRPNSLFLAGDLGQRIFQQPFSWKSLGVDVRGRSKTLRINYRTSHQIRMQADKLLGPEISDVDGNSETRSGTISVFNGPKPEIRTFPTQGAEIDAVAEWLQKQLADGLEPEEIGVFVRSEGQLARAMVAIERNHLEYHQLDQKMDTAGKFINLATMHLAKGLEFRAVVVMCCDDEVIPLQERIETAGESSDLEEVYNTERHLLYVACTRARDRLLLTATKPGSEFLDDME